MDISRRCFLSLVPLGLFSTLAKAGEPASSGLDGWFSSRQAVNGVARKFLQSPEFDPVRLQQTSRGLGRAGESRSWVAQQIESDFVHGDSVVIDGWVMARCEAELCVLASLETERGTLP
ncbi:MAG: hypothetical protein ACWA5X_01015 [bacterium]